MINDHPSYSTDSVPSVSCEKILYGKKIKFDIFPCFFGDCATEKINNGNIYSQKEVTEKNTTQKFRSKRNHAMQLLISGASIQRVINFLFHF